MVLLHVAAPVGIVWSFPGFSIIIIIDFFHLTGKWPSFAMALKSWVIVQTAQYGSSVIILGVMRSQPGHFFKFS